MTRLDAVSFFAFLLGLSVFVVPALWNISVRKTALRPVGIKSGLQFTAAWMFFVTGVLVLIEAFRNMLEPGRWEKERLFSGLDPGTVLGADAPVWNLLLGWILFPMRNLPRIDVSPEGIAVGIATFAVALFLVEFLGRRIFGHTWQTRWTFMLIAAFAWLDITAYSTVALVRQIAWML